MSQASRIEFILTAVDKGLSAGLNRALASIRSIGGESKTAGSGVGSLSSSIGGLVAKVGGVAAVAAGLQKLVSVSREFDKISAGLITATGSAENAEVAFSAISDFATKTPYDLAQVSDAFVKMVNMGLDPSERALTSYGNTSAALGKDLNQMVEAVADAATGEFERLKEFGIKSKQQGDQVTFTFRGVSTTVGKNAREIEDYLIKLGETNFGDAMENRMKTLDGALSNLGDEWDKVFLNISKAGIGDLIAKGVRVAIDALGELNDMISSGLMEGYLSDMLRGWKDWAEDVKYSIAIVRSMMSDDLITIIENSSKHILEQLLFPFKEFPDFVRVSVRLAVVEFVWMFERFKANAIAIKDTIKSVFTSDTVSGVGERLISQRKMIDGIRDASIKAIAVELAASRKASQDKINTAKKLRDANNAANSDQTKSSDKLAKYKAKGAGKESSSGTDEKARKAAEKQKKEQEKADKKAEAKTKKDEAERKKQEAAAAKLAAEKLRSLSQERLLALEVDRMDAAKLPTALERAEAEVAIDRKVMLEKVALKRQELDALKALSGADPAEIIRAESELSEARMDVTRAELEGQRTLAAERLAAIEGSWRFSAESVEVYKQAVSDAYQLGLMETAEYNERMIAAGDDMTAAFKLGFSQAMADIKTDAEVMVEIGQQVPERMASGLSDVIRASVSGFASMKQAVSDWAMSTLDWLSKVILQQMVLNALQNMNIGSLFGGGGSGGQAAATGAAMADGGFVHGFSPTPRSDNIQTWLTAGEFVHPVRAVDYYGVSFMEAVRKLAFPRNVAFALAGGTLPKAPRSNRLADGGMAAEKAPMTVKAGDTRLKVINVIDKNMVGDYLRSADGETAIINMIRRNGTVIRTLLG